MNKYIPILILFLGFAWWQPTIAQDEPYFDPIAEGQIKREIQTILNSYIEYGGLTESFTYVEDEYVEEFTKLFVPQARVLNDIGSPDNTEAYLPIETYMSLIAEWYPEGLTVELNDASGGIELKDGLSDKDIGKPYKYNDQYAIRVNALKQISGLTKNKNLTRRPFHITFIISFNEGLSEFKIAEVTHRQSLNEEVEQAKNEPKKPKKEPRPPKPDKEPKQKKEPKPEKPPKVPKRDIYTPTNKAETGLMVSLMGGAYLSTTQLDIGADVLDNLGISSWSDDSGLGVNAQLKASYFFSEKIGIGVGLGFTSYNSEIAVGNMGVNSPNEPENIDTTILINQRVFGASNITETVNFSSIDVSLMLEYKTPIANNLFLYGGIGARAALISDGGDFSRNASELYYQNQYGDDNVNVLEGIIPRNDAEAEFLEEYQLYDESLFTENDPRKASGEGLSLNSPNIMGVVDLGLAYSLNPRLKLKFGGTVLIGSNILDETGALEDGNALIRVDPASGIEVENIYNPIMNRKTNELKIFAPGIQIGFTYKLGNIDDI